MKAVVLTSLAHDVEAEAELLERGARPADGAVAVEAGLAARLRTVSGDEMLLVVRVDATEDGGARRAAAVGGGRAGAGLLPDGAVIGLDCRARSAQARLGVLPVRPRLALVGAVGGWGPLINKRELILRHAGRQRAGAAGARSG